jgi:heat shock protein HtpX
MTVVLLLLAALYLAMGAGLMAIYRADPTVPPYATVLAAAVILTAVLHYRGAGKLVLRTTRPRPVDRETSPVLVETLTRLAALADAPVPGLGVIHSSVANSFAVGLGGGDSVIVVTSALVDRLDPRELEAVLAHELAHILNHDARVMTLAGMPRTIGLVLIGTENAWTILWFFIWPLGLPLWGLERS